MLLMKHLMLLIVIWLVNRYRRLQYARTWRSGSWTIGSSLTLGLYSSLSTPSRSYKYKYQNTNTNIKSTHMNLKNNPIFMFNCQVVKKQKVFSPLISPKPRAKSVQRVHKLEMKKTLQHCRRWSISRARRWTCTRGRWVLPARIFNMDKYKNHLRYLNVHCAGNIWKPSACLRIGR